MNISTLNNLDSDVWRMILDNLYVPDGDAGEQDRLKAATDDVPVRPRTVPVLQPKPLEQ